jgi:hypothetical protein
MDSNTIANLVAQFETVTQSEQRQQGKITLKKPPPIPPKLKPVIPPKPKMTSTEQAPDVLPRIPPRPSASPRPSMATATPPLPLRTPAQSPAKPPAQTSAKPPATPPRPPSPVKFVQYAEDNPLLYPDITNTHKKPPIAPDCVEFKIPKVNQPAMSFSSPLLAVGNANGVHVFSVTKGSAKFIEVQAKSKITAVCFTQTNDLLCGTDKGNLYLINIHGSILDQRMALQPYMVTHIGVLEKKMFVVWDSGTMILWESPCKISASGQTMRMSPNRVLVQVAPRLDLWTTASLPSRSIDVYNPTNNSFFVKRIDVMSKVRGVGAVTALHASTIQPRFAFTGHEDGKLIVWNSETYEPFRLVWASFYKILSLVLVSDDCLWMALANGRVQVFDLSDLSDSNRSCRRLKDWSFSTQFLFTSLRDEQALDVLSVGDACRVWDGWRIDDWIEQQMYDLRHEYLTTTSMRTVVYSWNVAGQKPQDVATFPGGLSVLTQWIDDASDQPPDVLVIGLQEIVDLDNKSSQAKLLMGGGKALDTAGSQQRNQLWHETIQKAVADYDKQKYLLVTASSLVGLYAAVYVRQDWMSRVSLEASTTVKTGLGGMHGNKGAIVSRISLDDTTLCFVNCHLAAQQTQVVQRNNDIATIFKEAKFSPSAGRWMKGGNGEAILDHEICLVYGDLNYRLNGKRDEVISAIKLEKYQELQAIDQLNLSKRVVGWQANSLKTFIEPELKFAPTFKYDFGSTQYDSSEKMRIPAWTDRILHVGPVECDLYRRHEVIASDHRPISGSFTMQIGKVLPVERESLFQRVLLRGDAAFDKLRLQWLP